MTWTLSVRLWKLPRWVNARKALAVMNDAAAASGIGPAVTERARELTGREIAPVTLPGFHIFDGGVTPPYTWVVPKPQGDMECLLNYWEMYAGEVTADRKARLDPLRSIRGDRTVLSAQGFNSFFGVEPRGPGHWVSPAAKIIALAQHLPGQGQETLEVVLGGSQQWHRTPVLKVAMHMGNYYLEVTRKGLYTNFGRKTLEQMYRPGDASLDELSVRPMITKHPLAVALMENEETPHAALQAASVVFRAVGLGLLDPQEVRLSASSYRNVCSQDAVTRAFDVIQSGGSLRAVYDVLVPGLLSSRDFRTLFGSPFRNPVAVRNETKRRWVEALFSLAP